MAALKADRRLAVADKVVADNLASRAPGDKLECWPALDRIGADCGLSRQAVRMAVRNLAHFGYVGLDRDGSKRTGRTYILLWKVAGFAPAPVAGPSLREAECQRVQARQGRPTVGAGVCNDKSKTKGLGVGAGVCNSIPKSSKEALSTYVGPGVELLGLGIHPVGAYADPDALPPEKTAEAHERTVVAPTDPAKPKSNAPDPGVAESFTRLEREPSTAHSRAAVLALKAEFGATDRNDSGLAYRKLAQEVAAGRLA